MKKATDLIEQAAEFLLTLNETELSISLAKRHIQLVGEKRVCDPQLVALHQSGCYTDLLEAAEKGTVQDVDRTIFRHVLGLPRRGGEGEETFPTLTTLTLGTHQSVDELLQELEDEGNKVSDWARDIMCQDDFMLDSNPRAIELVAPTFRELGLPNGGTTEEGIAAGEALGLEPCPAEVGPLLRLNYPDQRKGEWCVIAMDPIADSVGAPLVFNVRRAWGDRWLFARHSSNRWPPEFRLVFLRRRT